METTKNGKEQGNYLNIRVKGLCAADVVGLL